MKKYKENNNMVFVYFFKKKPMIESLIFSTLKHLTMLFPHHVGYNLHIFSIELIFL